MPRMNDYTGTRLGRLYIESQVGRKDDSPLWKCVCECGNVVYYTSKQLRHNKPRSCGCLRSPDLTGRHFGRLEVIQRLERRDGNHNVYYLCSCDCGNAKEVTATDLLKGSVRSCGCLSEEALRETGKAAGRYVAEHHLKDGTNIKNLERSLFGEPRSNNTSGHTGVSWNSKRQKWEAHMRLKGKNIYLGRYDNIEDAIKARQRAEEELFLPIFESNPEGGDDELSTFTENEKDPFED